MYVVYSTLDIASSNIANALLKDMNFKESDRIEGRRHLVAEGVDVLEVKESLLDAEFLDNVVKADFFILLHKHSSAEGVPSFTTHPMGNWSDEVKFGGRPKELGFASPVNMVAMLKSLKKNNATNLQVTYEATHHGPLLKTPSFFVELGGNKETVENKELAGIVAKSIVSMISDDNYGSYDRIAIGIGGTHYPEKFTRLALEGKFAFAHMMPRYQVANVDMLGQAIERSDSKVEIAVIEWKSIKGADRENVLAKLKELGVDYERI